MGGGDRDWGRGRHEKRGGRSVSILSMPIIFMILPEINCLIISGESHETVEQ